MILAVLHRRLYQFFVAAISASLKPGNTAPFKKVLQRWQTIGNFVSNLTGPRFKPYISSRETKAILLGQLPGILSS